jgi:hypothetical protein
MIWSFVVYYTGYALAIFLCWNLGRIFRLPMLVNLAFNVALNMQWLSGWDIRAIMACYGFLFFLWTLALIQTLSKPTFVFLLLADLAVIFRQVMPAFHYAGSGQTFWNALSTDILEVWVMSIFGITVVTIFRSSVWAKWNGRRVDLLVNPKKRFVIPICLWAAIIAIPPWFGPLAAEWLLTTRFLLASQVLVWGWVVFELPYYVTYTRMVRQAA